MKILRIFFFSLTLISTPALADLAVVPDPVPPQPADSTFDSYAWKVRHTVLWDLGNPALPNFTELVEFQLHTVLNDRLQTPENRYLAANGYTAFHFVTNMRAVHWTCEQFPPRVDDYAYRNRCLYAADMDPDERIRQIYEIAELAYKAAPQRMDGANIYNMLADHLSLLSRSNESLHAYRRSFEIIPPGNEEHLVDAKLNLAFAYSNPMYSEKLRKESLRNYKEVIAWYKTKTGPYYEDQVMFASYNMGIAALFLFDDVPTAIEAFKVALPHESTGADARVFLAFSYAKIGEEAKARDMLASFNKINHNDLNRVAFLTCYHDLTLLKLGDKANIKSCLNLEAPQADVLLHLTQILMNMKLSPADENKWLRMFYRIFIKNMLPDMQQSIDSASSEAELVRERAEGRLKDLKLQNLNLYEYLVAALGGLAFLFGIAGFLAFKAQRSAWQHGKAMNMERKRLQNILDSIEEGIFLVQPDLSMEAEESEHLKNIMGSHYEKRTDLIAFLKLSAVEADLQATTVSCLQAALGEDRLVWDLNQGNLITEMNLGEKYLALFWQPIFDQDQLKAIFLAIRDVTAVQLLKIANAKAQEDADKVLIFVKQILKGHTVAVLNFLGDLNWLLSKIGDEIQRKEFSLAMRATHTIKGTARSLGLSDLREIAHRLEDFLQKNDEASIVETFADVRSVSRLYLSAQHFVQEGSHQRVMDLFQVVSELRGGMEEHLQESGLVAGEIHVQEVGRLTSSEYEKVREMLLHGLTNATDHGFIIPFRSGRPVEIPRISIELLSHQQERLLLIRDNGVGIQHDTLKALAETQGWRPQADETWTDFLFADGVTTASAVTMSSGRGVGLAAIKQVAQSLGGRVHLRDNESAGGACLELRWPIPDAGSSENNLLPKAG